MKLSKYVALAKRGYCKVIHVQNSGIWLGLKCAIYRAVELPDIHGEGQARAVLDIPEKAWGNTFFEEENAEGEHDICGFDMTGGAWELPAEELELQVNYKGVQATALRCTNGELLFYDSRLATPVSDVMRDSEYVQTVIRKRRSGQRVIVIKDGFEAIAAITPMKVINSAFLKALSELDSACVEQYERESKVGLATQEEPATSDDEDV